MLCLAPGTGRETLGWLLLAESVVLLVTVAWLATSSARPVEGRPPSRVAAPPSAAATPPFLVGAISLLAGSGGGLYWTLGGVIGAFVGAVLNAWVLLVEILR